MITVNASAVQQSILKAKLEIENKLKSMVVGLAKDVADAATQATPLGDAQKYASLYKLRSDTKGYREEEGLARGNWQYSANGGIAFVPNYGQDSASTAVSDVTAEAKATYKVGDTFYIANNLDYIGILEKRRPGEGIMYPALDILLSIYKIDLKSNYDSGVTI